MILTLLKFIPSLKIENCYSDDYCTVERLNIFQVTESIVKCVCVVAFLKEYFSLNGFLTDLILICTKTPPEQSSYKQF